MNFDNPVYRKTTEEQFALEKSDYEDQKYQSVSIYNGVSSLWVFVAYLSFHVEFAITIIYLLFLFIFIQTCLRKPIRVWNRLINLEPMILFN